MRIADLAWEGVLLVFAGMRGSLSSLLEKSRKGKAAELPLAADANGAHAEAASEPDVPTPAPVHGPGPEDASGIVGAPEPPASVASHPVRYAVSELAGNVVRGWVLDPSDPDRRMALHAVLELRNTAPTRLGTITADRPADFELDGARVTTPCGFELRVPAQPDVAKLRLFEASTGLEIDGSPVHLGVAPRLEGYLDGLDSAGRVGGWAWGTSAEYRCDIDITIDGRYAGTAFALEHRDDLVHANIGSGDYGFYWRAPDDFLDGQVHEVGCVFHGTSRHLVQSPSRFRLARFTAHASLGRDRILRGVLIPKAEAGVSGDRLQLELRLSGETLCPITAEATITEFLHGGGKAALGYHFALPLPAVGGTLEIAVPETAERYPVEIIEAEPSAAARQPAQIPGREIARAAMRWRDRVERATNQAQFLVPVWDRRSIDDFCGLCLPSLLSPGNLPALIEGRDFEFTLLTRAADAEVIARAPSYRRLQALVPVRVIAIDDIVSTFFDPMPGKTTGAALTHAYFRGIKSLGDKAISTDFIFWNADFIAADGALTALAERIDQGSRCTMAPSLRADPGARAALTEKLSPERDILSIGPRELVRIALDNLHPTVKAKIVNRPSGQTIENIERFYWAVGDDLLLCRTFLPFMLHIRPEQVWDDVNGFCDYAFVPEMTPNSEIVYETESDRVCIVEFQDALREMELLRSASPPGGEEPEGSLSAETLARSIDHWATEEHVAASRHLFVFDGRAQPGAALSTAENLAAAHDFDRFMSDLYSHLGDHRQWHNGHVYWRLAYQVLGKAAGKSVPPVHADPSPSPVRFWPPLPDDIKFDAPLPEADRPRSRTANLLRWTGYDLDIVKDSWANPPFNLTEHFLAAPSLVEASGEAVSRWLDDLFDLYVSAWVNNIGARLVDENYLSLVDVTYFTTEQELGHTVDFSGCRWGLVERRNGLWCRRLGPGGVSILLHRTTQRTGFVVSLRGRSCGGRSVSDLAVTINGAAPCGRLDQTQGDLLQIDLHVSHARIVEAAGRLIVELTDRKHDPEQPGPGFVFFGYQIFPDRTAETIRGDIAALSLRPSPISEIPPQMAAGWWPTPPSLDRLAEGQIGAPRTRGEKVSVDLGGVFFGTGWGAPFNNFGDRYRWLRGGGGEIAVVCVAPGQPYTITIEANPDLSFYELALNARIEVNGCELGGAWLEVSAASLAVKGFVPRAVVDEFDGWLAVRVLFDLPLGAHGRAREEYGEPAGGAIAAQNIQLVAGGEVREPSVKTPSTGAPRVKGSPAAAFWARFLATRLSQVSQSELRRIACRRLGVDPNLYESAAARYGGRALASWVACQPEAARDTEAASAWLRAVDAQIEWGWRHSLPAAADGPVRVAAADGFEGTGFGDWTQCAGLAARRLTGHPASVFLSLDPNRDWAVSAGLGCAGLHPPRLDAVQFHLGEAPLLASLGYGSDGVLRADLAFPAAALRESDGQVVLRVETADEPDSSEGVALIWVEAAPAALTAEKAGACLPEFRNFTETARSLGLDPRPYLAAALHSSERLTTALAECPAQKDSSAESRETIFAYYDWLLASELQLPSPPQGDPLVIDLAGDFDGIGWAPVGSVSGRAARPVGPAGSACFFCCMHPDHDTALAIEGCASLAEVALTDLRVTVNGAVIECSVEIVDDAAFQLLANIPREALENTGGRIALRIDVGETEPEALGFRSVTLRSLPSAAAPGPVSMAIGTALRGGAVLAAAAGLRFPADYREAGGLPDLTQQERLIRRLGRDPSLYEGLCGQLGPAVKAVFEHCPGLDPLVNAQRWLDLLDRTIVEALIGGSVPLPGPACPVLGETVGLGWGPLIGGSGEPVRTLSASRDATLLIPPITHSRYVVEISLGSAVNRRTLLFLRATTNRRSHTKQAISIADDGLKLRVWIDQSVADFGLGWVALRLYIEGTPHSDASVSFHPGPGIFEPFDDILVRRVEIVADEAENAAAGGKAAAAASGVGLGAALPTAIHCVIPVWGSDYTKTFLDSALPSHLAPGNLPGLRDTKVIYEIYTDAEGRAAIEKHPLFAALQRAVSEVVFFDTRQFRMEERTHHQLVLNYTIMNRAHQTSIGRASGHGGALLFLNCDTVYSESVFSRVWELVRDGYRTVENLSIRTDRDEMLEALMPLRSADGILSMTSADLTRIALKRLHWIARGRFWEGPPGLTIPDNLYWWVADSAILARATHFMPLLVFPRTQDIRYLGTIDHGFVPAAGIAESERWLMDSDSEPSSYELSLTSHDQHFPHYERGSVRDLARFLSIQCEFQHMRNLQRPVRISAEPVAEERWQEIAAQSGDILDAIRLRLQKYVLTPWRPDGATEADECALIWDPAMAEARPTVPR